MNWNRITAQTIFYPTLCWNMLLGRWLKLRNWWDSIEGTDIILGAMPFSRDVERLHALGVRGVVNTCEEYTGPLQQYEQFQISQFRMPTIDFTHPKLEDVEDAVEFMEQQFSAGHKVYVHCKAGRARSATVVVCWLIKYRQMTADAAQQLLLKCRPHVNSRLPQRPVVRDFEQRHRPV